MMMNLGCIFECQAFCKVSHGARTLRVVVGAMVKEPSSTFALNLTKEKFGVFSIDF